MMVEAMQYGPFICAYGIKLHDSDFSYDLDVSDSMSDLRERKASLNKDIIPKHKQKPITDKPDEIAMLFETTRVSK